jgi:hypothetical protein
MVVGNSTKDAYAEFAEAAAERAVNAGGTALKNTNPVQLRPTNVDGAPPVLNIKTHGASGPSGSVESAPWVIGSNVRPNNGIISPARSDPLMVTVPKPGDVPTRFGSINGGSGETGGLLSRAAGLAPPRQSPSRGMSLSRSPSVSPLRTADVWRRGGNERTKAEAYYGWYWVYEGPEHEGAAEFVLACRCSTGRTAPDDDEEHLLEGC